MQSRRQVAVKRERNLRTLRLGLARKRRFVYVARYGRFRDLGNGGGDGGGGGDGCGDVT